MAGKLSFDCRRRQASFLRGKNASGGFYHQIRREKAFVILNILNTASSFPPSLPDCCLDTDKHTIKIGHETQIRAGKVTAASSAPSSIAAVGRTPYHLSLPGAATGSGQPTFITPSTKKRKVARPNQAAPAADDHIQTDQRRRGPSADDDLAPRLLPFLSSPSDSTALRSQSASPIRYLPPHLQAQVSDGSGRVALTTPESCFPTAASSPSRAYSGLSLGGDPDEAMSGGDVDADGDLTLTSPAIPTTNGTTTTSPYFPTMSALNDVDTALERSSSPALKRPASELDEHRPEDEEMGSPLRVASGSDNTDMAETFDPPNHSRQASNESSPKRNGKVSPAPAAERPSVSERQGDGVSLVATGTGVLANGAHPVFPPNGHRALPARFSPVKPRATVPLPISDVLEVPSIDEQVANVTSLAMRPLRGGDEGHVVSCKWVERVKAKGSDKRTGQTFVKELVGEEIGPLDNSDLVPEGKKSADDTCI